MAKRRLLRKRKTLTVRVNVPMLEELTRWANKDGIDRGELVRRLIEREAKDRIAAEAAAVDRLDRMARDNAEATGRAA